MHYVPPTVPDDEDNGSKADEEDDDSRDLDDSTFKVFVLSRHDPFGSITSNPENGTHNMAQNVDRNHRVFILQPYGQLGVSSDADGEEELLREVASLAPNNSNVQHDLPAANKGAVRIPTILSLSLTDYAF